MLPGIGNLGINISEYANPALNDVVLFGEANTSQDRLNDLAKALEAGQLTGRETADLTTASGSPLKVESLDKNLKVITFKEQEIKLWKKIPKLSAYNTVEEYNQLTSYGSERGGFNLEGELPQEEDSTYVRRAQHIKFMGVTKSVTHPMTLVNTMIGDAIEREVKNGTLWILRKLNRALTKADAAMIPEEFSGLYAQHFTDEFSTFNDYMNSDVVIDLRGRTLQEGDLEDGAEIIIERHGFPTDMFAPPKALSGFVKNFYGNKYINPNTAQTAAGIMGQRVESFDSQYGRFALDWDIFMNPANKKAYNSGATHVNAPNQVTAGSVTPVAATVANTKWGADDDGDYYYGVVGVNRFGESAMTVLNSGAVASIVAGGAADLTWTNDTGPNAATCFQIYRSNNAPVSLASAVFYPLFTVSISQKNNGHDGGGAAHVYDLNRFMPDTFQAFMIENDEEVLAYRQLAPLMKMDLAIISPAFRFMILQYGTPLLFAGGKMVRFINIGKSGK